MIVRCWGSRGSIPVSGRQYLRYGGDTTCIEVRSSSGEVLVIDAGSGLRRLGNRLVSEGIYTITLLFTHAHWDHLLAFPFFKPIYFSRTLIDIHACPFGHASVQAMIAPVMEAPYFPVSYDQLQATVTHHAICQSTLELAGLTVQTIPLSHPNHGVGYRISEGEHSFVFLTDNELSYLHDGGCSFEEYVRFSAGADLLLHDAEYTPQDYEKRKTWGHSVYTDALELALRAGVRSFGLFHHNQERSDGQLDEIVRNCQLLVKKRGSELRCFGAAADQEWRLG
ncbi:MAG: metal-dependent hydrolase [Deltaproteobacteria bacterium RIFOXYA12_FULL_61_11]|nr:MAG: metal-dependent hydrolase [Deltaproteobacteria bacterium RIFOXYA12_FULL_61_11]